MRFHVVWRKSHEPESAYRDFFETNDIDEAKDFAMRLAFDETNLVFVRDEKRDEVVRDFDAEVYRREQHTSNSKDTRHLRPY